MAKFKLSGLKGMSTWCDVCGCLSDHNTLYHRDEIKLHSERGDVDINLLLLIIILVCVLLLVFKAF